MYIALCIFITLCAASVAVPVIFRGRLKDGAELAMILGVMFCTVVSPFLYLKADYFSIVANLGGLLAFCSPQGRATLVNFAFIPFILSRDIYYGFRNRFLFEKSRPNSEFWRDTKSGCLALVGGVQNWDMELKNKQLETEQW